MFSVIFITADRHSMERNGERITLIDVCLRVKPCGFFHRFKEDPYVSAEGITAEQGGRRG